MAEESKNMPVNTFLAIGAIIGLFVVFQGWRDSGDEETPEINRIERLDGHELTAPPQPLRDSAEQSTDEQTLSAQPRHTERSFGQLWEQPRPGVYCLNADCSNVRVSAGAEPPCEDDTCSPAAEGMVCIENDCQSYASVQANADFVPATNRLTRRIKERVNHSGSTPPQPLTLELMMDDYGNVHSAKTVLSSGDTTYDRAVRYAALNASPFTELRGTLPHTRSLLQLIHINIEP